MKKFVVAAAFISLIGPAVCGQWVAKVNGAEISQKDVLQALWDTYSAQTVEAMVNEQLVRQEAKKRGISPDSAEVDARIGLVKKQLGSENTFMAELKKQGLTPETFRRKAELLILTEDLVKKVRGLTVSDDEVKAYFEREKGNLGLPEVVKLRQIAVKTMDEAKAVVSALDAGADFAKLASSTNISDALKASGGEVGYLSRAQLPAEVADQLFKMKPGQYSAAIKLGDFYSVLKVEEVKPAVPADFNVLKDDIRQAIMASKIRQALPDVVAEIKARSKIEYKNPVIK